MKNNEYININVKLKKTDFTEDFNKFKTKVKKDLEYTNMTNFFKKQIKNYINKNKD